MTRSERATFAAGCFWGVEETFRIVPGVLATSVGYTGGSLENPTYDEVCSGTTFHAEAIEIEFDPARVSYRELLDLFFRSHDPTTLNRQGPDRGTQYRSAVFYHGDAQREEALAAKQAIETSGQLRGRTVVTEIVPASRFWRAEAYHQRYLQKRRLGSCHVEV